MSESLPDQAILAKEIILDEFTDSVVGIYLFGSAVVGGLQLNSDIDILVALNRHTAQFERKRLLMRLMTLSGDGKNTNMARPLELTIVCVSSIVPWQYPPESEFLYGEWLRTEFENGIIPQPTHDPDLVIVLKKVVDSSLVLAGKNAAEVFESVPAEDVNKAIKDSLPALLSSIRGDERNVLLTLARMWFTVSCGSIVSKDYAATWAESRLQGEQSTLLNDARMAYIGKAKDVWKGKESAVDRLANAIRKKIEACLFAE